MMAFAVESGAMTKWNDQASSESNPVLYQQYSAAANGGAHLAGFP